MEKWDKDKLKFALTIEEVFDFVEQLGGSPRMSNDFFVSQTICHNKPGEGSYKLYYYNNTHLFKCYTGCSETGGFDIYELTCKVKRIAGEEWSLPRAVKYVAAYFGYLVTDFAYDSQTEKLEDWEKFEIYDKLNIVKAQDSKIVELNYYDSSVLNHLPFVAVKPWLDEGISLEIMQQREIKYNPSSCGVVIPHRDENGNLIGIRERTLVEDNEKYGKYRPSMILGKMYNHPLSFALYNLNNSKDNISKIKKAIVFESEKSCLLYASFFGAENDISVACCGSSLIAYQVKLLLSLGVEEIIVAFDRQFKEPGDEEFVRWTKKLEGIKNKYGKYTTISFMFDKEGLLPYKASPIDAGQDVFLKLFRNRIIF